MGATNKATTPLNLYDHWCLILNGYLGKECIHTQVTRTLDLNGDVIDETETQTTIYGALSPVSESAVQESVGFLQYGDLVAYFLVEDGVEISEQFGQDSVVHHLITYQDVAYSVIKRTVTAYDDSEAVVSKYVLRKGTDEWT